MRAGASGTLISTWAQPKHSKPGCGGVSGDQHGEAASVMTGPIVLFSILIAGLWAWSLFTHPQVRCTRCTSPHLGPLRIPSSHPCHKCGGTGTRQRLGVAALRTLGWEIAPTGRMRRRGAPSAGTGRGPGHHPPAR